MPYPTRRLALLLALSAPLWLLSGSAAGMLTAVTVTGGILVAAGVDIVRRPTAGSLTVERELPETIGLGQRTTGRYLIGSAWPRRLDVAVYDRLPSGLAPSSRYHDTTETPPARHGASVTVAAHGRAELPLVVVGQARGSHALDAVALRVSGRWGLVDSVLRPLPTGAATVTVAPSIAGIRRYRLLALQRRLRDSGVRQLRRRGQGTSFANLREYAVGDDPRHIDWKATARRGRPIVREYSVEQGQSVILAIDAGRMMTQHAGESGSRFEDALSAALILADVSVQSGDQVGLLLFDDEVRSWLPPVRGTLALQRIRAALVPARPTMTEPDYAAAFRTLATHHRRRSLVVLFTDVLDERASRTLVALTTRGTARHALMVVALRNDALTAATTVATDGPTSALYEAAAAEELVQARETALQRMRRAAVEVVDVSPRQLAAAVVNRYLELKARSAV